MLINSDWMMMILLSLISLMAVTVVAMILFESYAVSLSRDIIIKNDSN